MIFLKVCRIGLIRVFLVLIIISSLLVPPGFCQETEDSQIFIAGFNAYQQKDYKKAVERMSEVLQKFPDTSLRDMAMFWLARAQYKGGNQREAARVMSQFSKEYPDNPLKGTVEEELLDLAARYDKGEKLPEPPAGTQAQTGPAVKKGAPPTAAADQEDAARFAAERLEQERQAAQRQEEQRKNTEQAEQERLARLTQEQESAAAEAKRLAAQRQEQERQAALHAEKAEQERLAAQRAGQEAAAVEAARLAAERREQERQAAVKAEQGRQTAEKAEQERVAAVKAEQERLALAARKAEEAKAAEAARTADEKRRAAEKAAAAAEATRAAEARKEQQRLAATRAEEQRLVRLKAEQEKAQAAKRELREKAIAQYKAVIEKYPYSAAATTAAAKLKELGITVALPERPAEPENAQILRLEVAQFSALEFALLPGPRQFEVAKRIALPFELTNRGNGNDTFYFESGFPADFNASFAAASAPDQPISQSSTLAPGQTFKGVLNLTIPAGSIDGRRISHPVRAVSRAAAEAAQSRELALTASAPLLRAVVKTEKTRPLPGETVTYRVAILNVGSTAARNVTFRLNYPPQMEPVNYAQAGFRQEMKSALVLDNLQVNSGESRELTVSLQVKEDSLAGQELLARAELVNNPLKTAATFVSNAATVQAQRGIAVRSATARLVAIPGQTLTVPFTITNTGNIREKFRISSTVSGATTAMAYSDVNRDNIRQANEPYVTEIGPLEPREEAVVALEIKTPATAADGGTGEARILFVSDADASRTAAGTASLAYSRPVLQLAMSGQNGRLKPGEITSFDLTITNRGSNLARVVDLSSTWPEQLELVAAQPVSTPAKAGNIQWKFNELGAGEKRTIRVSFRVRPGTGVGTALQVRNVLKYEDQLGNRY